MSWNMENEDCVFAGEIDAHRTNPTCDFTAHNGNYCVQQNSIRPGFGVQCDPTGPIKEYCPDGSLCPPLKPGAKYSLCPGEDPAFCADTPNTKESCSGPIPGSPAGKYLWCKKDGPSPKPGPAPGPKPGPKPGPGPAPAPKPGPAPPELCGIVESEYKHPKIADSSCFWHEKTYASGCCKNDNLLERGMCISLDNGAQEGGCITDYGYHKDDNDICSTMGDKICSNLDVPWYGIETRSCVPDYRSPLGFGCISGYNNLADYCYAKAPNDVHVDGSPLKLSFCRKNKEQLKADNQHDLVAAMDQTASCLTGGEVGYYVPYQTYSSAPSGNCRFKINDKIEDMNTSNRYKCNLVDKPHKWYDDDTDKPVDINSNNTYWNFRTQSCEPIKAQHVDDKGNKYWKPPLTAYSRWSKKPE